jgi:DNA-binding IclR family transcriptional regulator
MPQPAAPQSVNTGVKSAVRTIEIIEYFAEINRPARTREISDALDLPNSSVDDLLRTLAAMGYLSFDRRSKLYAPSYKIVGMMQAIERGFFGGDRLRRLLLDLKMATGGSVYMTTQNDCWLENVAEIPGSWTVPPDTEIENRWQILRFDGTSWLPGTNFAGALLALQSNVEIIDLAVRTQNLGIAPKGAFVMSDLIGRVQRIRSRGFALCRRNDTLQVEAIACPMRLPNGNMPVAVGVLGNDLLGDEQRTKKLAATIHGLIAHHRRSWTDAAV